MRTLRLTTTCLLLSMIVNAQSPVLQWAKKMGGNSSDRGLALAVDGSGNVYSTGYFDGTVDFDPGAGTFNLSSAGNDDVFISKLDASGNFVWAKKMGGTLYEQGMSIAVDGTGNAYIAGYFQGTADFDPGAATFNLTVAGSDDIFVSKLDASGNFVWARKMGGTGSDRGNSITVDGTGNVYTTGYFSGTADFDPGAGTFNLTVAGTSDIFISKLDASGNFAWAKQLGGNSNNRGFSIALDGSGNIYTTGYFSGTADFDPGAGVFNLTSFGGTDIFISKSDASGNFSWAKQMGGVSDEYGYSIVIDGSGNVHTTGRFIGTADFDPGAAAVNLTAAGGIDIYVSKLNVSGNFVWAKRMGGTSTDAGSSIALDPSGNVYTTGYFSGTADFDPGAATFNLTSATFEIYISKLNSSGNFVWAGAMGGTGSDQGYALALDVQGNIYSTGNFSGTADFDPGAGTFNLVAAGPMDIYVQKTSQCIPPSAIITPGASTTFCTGGSVALNANTGTGYTYQWKLNTVNITGATNISYTASAAGIYTVVVTNSCGSATSAPVTVTVNSLPAAAITPSGSAAFCTGGSVLLQATTGTGFTYQWKKNTLNISGATTASYSANTAGSYTVVITNACGSSTSPAVTVTENPAPSATITANGPVTFCAGGSVVLSASTGAGYVYQWKNGGVNIGGATAQTYSATTTGNYTVQITSAGCTAVSNAISVAVQNTLTPTITETSVIYCPSTTVRLETVTGSGYAYQWFEDNFSIPAATAYQFNTGHNGNYKVSVTNACGTYTSSFFILNNTTLASTPFTVIAAQSQPTLCPGGNVTLYDISSNSYYYYYYNHQWYKDGVAIPSATGDFYSATQPGNYSVAVSDYNFYCGPSPTVFSNWITVTSAAGTYPTINISAAGPTTYCTGGSVLLQSSATGSAPLSYQWKLNGVDISGATSSTYTTGPSGNYTCSVSNSCSTATSNYIPVTVQIFPVANISASGTTNLCTGGSVTLTATTGSWTYQWKKNGINVSGATSYNYFANTAGNYTVETANACGTANSNSITVTLYTTPTVSISAGGPLAFCTGGSVTLNSTGTGVVYQWRKNGVNISGATASSYVVTITGSYTLLVTNASGYCSALSNTIPVSVFGSTFLVLQPNGATGIDAIVSSYSSQVNTNYGASPEFNALAWTAGGSPAIHRGYIRFDLSSVPANAVINQATLTLFNHPTSSNGLPTGQHSSYTGSNAALLQRVTSAWNENTITWNNQPTTTTVNQVALPQSTSGFQDYDIDVTSSVQNMFINPGSNFGFMLRQQTESYYRALVFASSDNADATNWPRLSISYSYDPGITASGPTTFCSGGNAQLNTSQAAGLTYQWKLNGINISGATASSYLAATSGNYTVVVTDLNNCSNISSQLTITVNPLPTVSFSGLAASYNVSAPAATLTGSPSGGTFSGPGISGNTFTPSVAGVGGPYTIVYSYTDVNGCSNNSSQQTTVTSCIVPAQPGTITVTGGSAKVCPGDTRTYTIVAVSGATSYTWTPPAGATIASGQGNTSVSINYTAGFTASGTLSVVANSACGSSIAKTLTVSRNNPATPSVISGASSAVCAATSGAYSVTNVAGMTYNWTAPANASIMSGQGTNAVTVSFSALWISGPLSVTAANNCGTSNARTLSILSKPATPSTIVGASNTVCAGTTGNYSVTNVPGVTYDWIAPANASIASGQGTNAVSVNFSALFTSGPLKVSGSNSCGSSALRSLSIASVPAKPGTITGPAYANCNAVGNYSIVAVANATSYTWSTNIAGAVITPNGTSASIAFPTFTSGIVSVTANNSCGSSIVRTLTVKGTPATPASITGPALVCANQFGVPYSISAIPTATSYTWTGMAGSHISDGTVTSSGATLTTTSTSVTVNFGNTAGNLSVKAINPCGAGSSKTLAIGFNCRDEDIVVDNDFSVTVYPNPSSSDFVFNISNASNEKVSINIYDMIGKLVLSKDFHDSQFIVDDPLLTQGSYLVEVIWNGNKKAMKLVKIK